MEIKKLNLVISRYDFVVGAMKALPSSRRTKDSFIKLLNIYRTFSNVDIKRSSVRVILDGEEYALVVKAENNGLYGNVLDMSNHTFFNTFNSENVEAVTEAGKRYLEALKPVFDTDHPEYKNHAITRNSSYGASGENSIENTFNEMLADGHIRIKLNIELEQPEAKRDNTRTYPQIDAQVFNIIPEQHNIDDLLASLTPVDGEYDDISYLVEWVKLNPQITSHVANVCLISGNNPTIEIAYVVYRTFHTDNLRLLTKILLENFDESAVRTFMNIIKGRDILATQGFMDETKQRMIDAVGIPAEYFDVKPGPLGVADKDGVSYWGSKAAEGTYYSMSTVEQLGKNLADAVDKVAEEELKEMGQQYKPFNNRLGDNIVKQIIINHYLNKHIL